MIQILLIGAGLLALVVAAFLVFIPLGIAALGGALIFAGWASPDRPPRE